MRMIVRGVFDAYPNLKIIMGHLGEAFPFLVDRVDRAWMQNHQKPNPEIGPGSKERAGYYLKKNLWVTTSGNYLPAAFVCTRDAIGMDKILLGTDFPYEDMKDCMDYLAQPAPDRRRSVRTVRGQRQGPRFLIPSILEGRCGRPRNLPHRSSGRVGLRRESQR